MQPTSRHDDEREQLAAEYLRVLQEFSAELDAATSAITRNALADFEDSVRRQEALSGRVREIVTAINSSWDAAGQQVSSKEQPELVRQINLAFQRFQQLNLRYAALLKHSSHSVALMSSLCRTYGAEIPVAPGTTQPKQQTWSCEA